MTQIQTNRCGSYSYHQEFCLVSLRVWLYSLLCFLSALIIHIPTAYLSKLLVSEICKEHERNLYQLHYLSRRSIWKFFPLILLSLPGWEGGTLYTIYSYITYFSLSAIYPFTLPCRGFQIYLYGRAWENHGTLYEASYWFCEIP